MLSVRISCTEKEKEVLEEGRKGHAHSSKGKKSATPVLVLA